MLIFPLFCRSEEKADAEVDDGDVLPSATKLKVKYGRGRNQKIYEAKVRQAGAEFSGSSCNMGLVQPLSASKRAVVLCLLSSL